MKNILIILSFSMATSLMSFSEDGNHEYFKGAHFSWNGISYLSASGEIVKSSNRESRDLIFLFGSRSEELKLIDYFYKIQSKLIKFNLEVVGINKSNSGNLKIFLKDKRVIKIQDFKINDQLDRLQFFLTSNESKKIMANFKSIDLRYKNKIAIKYLNG